MAYCNNGANGGNNWCGCNGNGNGNGNNGCNNTCVSGAYDNCGGGNGLCGSGFSCVVNLIIILIVLQFLTQIICGLNCD